MYKHYSRALDWHHEKLLSPVIIKDSAFSFIQCSQQWFLQVSELQLELSLQLEQIWAPFVDIRTLGLQNLVEALALQGATGHSEVHKCHTRTDVGWELDLQTQDPCCSKNKTEQVIFKSSVIFDFITLS